MVSSLQEHVQKEQTTFHYEERELSYIGVEDPGRLCLVGPQCTSFLLSLGAQSMGWRHLPFLNSEV